VRHANKQREGMPRIVPIFAKVDASTDDINKCYWIEPSPPR
jgi:hypothetical protein